VQSEYLNALAYLINAELLDISPKYALLLDEKARNDRNKAISNEVNAALKSISNIHEIEISENQVADAFSKTIRDKTAEALTLWRKPVKPFEAVSDSDAVEYGKILGLVSMPAKVKKLLYESIDIGQE
jgi:ribosome maturation protein Sdo1